LSIKLARAIREAVQDKDIAAKIEKNSIEIENRGPEETAKILPTFNQKWTDIAKNAKIVAE
jgi:tripartite-type tricarboxylate transporter receptor subunit TctC